ncbi:dihydroneopterin aldolase [Blochmannia endosymbiont of Polyrhachis (Hedomyrma) turneri]|uniref:dihydroneopterin aldolase n=1 Tax=Blochmannia endosymbiont of Polyrhachis (Hedomyrma) turneri TaxID=1505596 RepID=UPI00061A89FD|nr:dihydroneopterin aldolase [Blochmannia endosymbiont of Polyrhachis (Hedomyrma) turneri]AKC59651.1 dihydroneopterin aldolase [Blochmannia endosymbiont of Polyrhachis (Hedomyrma) turneri]
MNILFIKGLVVTTVIGIYNWERNCLQKLIFDLEIGYYYDQTKIFNDQIQDYLNYQDVSDVVSVLVSHRCFFLLESVAECVASELMFRFGIPWIRVKVSKFGALAKDVDVGIIIERGKKR